jgi:Cellulase (glycosyl hydrolase family 5)
LTYFRRAVATACFLSLLTAVSGATSTITTPTSAIPATFFGMSENGVAAWSPWPAASFGTLRMWDTGSRWDQIETSAGHYNWAKTDKVVTLARNNGKDLIYTFGGTPAWASSNPGLTSCAYSKGTCAVPKAMSDLSTFARAVATRYKGRIKYYELWNEPNDLHYYNGSMANMVAMAAAIRDAVKSVDPSAVVLSPCPTWSSSGAPYTWMTNFLKAGGGAHFDVAAYHAYPGTAGPEFVINSVQNMRNALTNNGYGSKAIFITEGGWGENKYFATDDLRANFVARYIVLAWAKHVGKLAWYAYDSTTWGTLYTPTGGLRPAGTAFNQVHKWLTGATMKSCAQDSNATWSCTLTRANGYTAEILWNPSKTTGHNVSTSLVRKHTVSGGLSSFSGGLVTVGPKPILVENKAGF